MKKKVLLLTAFAVLLLLITFLVSCRVSQPDIDTPSVHYITPTRVALWWDYEDFTKPFTLFYKESTQATMSEVADIMPPYIMNVESDKAYEWKVVGVTGAVGGPWEFSVP